MRHASLCSLQPNIIILSHPPFTLPPQVTLQFKPPTAVSVVGSYALHTVARPDVVVDVAVEIPEACLFKKAHLNYRWGDPEELVMPALDPRDDIAGCRLS